MAKTLIDTNLFAKTGTPELAPQPSGPTDDTRKRRKRDSADPVKSYGIGLRQSDWAKFSAIASELGISYHDLGVFVLTDFMARWERGERPPTETKQVLKRS
jgi:hypothetical protein